ncbi:MAG: BtpA/SgcQ family protein [Pyrinomonadaceae bacterium]|nr:BtpA/SgcQ family protein [Phycisphaerales bacterium]
MTPLPRAKMLIGMIHVAALPGSPANVLGVRAIVEQARREARILAGAGFDAVMIENMHDRPYIHGTHPAHTVALMTSVAIAVREQAPDLPLGVQILSGGSAEAIAVALAAAAVNTTKKTPMSFIRCENFVFSHVADEGLLAKAEAGPLLRYRRSIGAGHIAVFTDIKKKHASHAITGDVTIGEMAEAAEFFGSSGVIVTGPSTGKPVDMSELQQVRQATALPVLVGSGVTPETVGPLFEHADALIVGSWFKKDGVWSNPPDPKRCRSLARAVEKAR